MFSHNAGSFVQLEGISFDVSYELTYNLRASITFIFSDLLYKDFALGKTMFFIILSSRYSLMSVIQPNAAS